MAGFDSLPPKRTASINGRTFEYVCSGSGTPSIVLMNGAAGPIEGWYKIFAGLELLGTVFAYNRLGVGNSDRPIEPQTGNVVVAALHALLTAIGLPPPYILVGHSIGGLFANVFARTHPDEIGGVVLLDATAPDDVRMLAEHKGVLQRVLERTLDAVLGANEFGEVANAETSANHVESAGPFPNVPLVVVTGGRPSRLMPTMVREIRASNQRALCSHSPKGHQIIASRSGHFPQFSEPDLVIDAIRSVSQQVRA